MFGWIRLLSQELDHTRGFVWPHSLVSGWPHSLVSVSRCSLVSGSCRSPGADCPVGIDCRGRSLWPADTLGCFVRVVAVDPVQH